MMSPKKLHRRLRKLLRNQNQPYSKNPLLSKQRLDLLKVPLTQPYFLTLEINLKHCLNSSRKYADPEANQTYHITLR